MADFHDEVDIDLSCCTPAHDFCIVKPKEQFPTYLLYYYYCDKVGPRTRML